jgi:hypothetical protein
VHPEPPAGRCKKLDLEARATGAPKRSSGRTKVLPFHSFKLNEENYLDYYHKDPARPFCRNIENPKLKELLSRFAKHISMLYKQAPIPNFTNKEILYLFQFKWNNTNGRIQEEGMALKQLISKLVRMPPLCVDIDGEFTAQSRKFAGTRPCCDHYL